MNFPLSPPNQKALRNGLFILRCTTAAAVSYMIAARLGLDYPSWASVSAIIVSQESLSDTRTAALQRLAGTILGVAVAVACGEAMRSFDLPVVVQMSLGVAVCSWIARRWPQYKVAMWTVPIVYLSNTIDPSPFTDGLWRGIEVLVGGLTGAVIHFGVDTLFRKLCPPLPQTPSRIDHSE